MMRAWVRNLVAVMLLGSAAMFVPVLLEVLQDDVITPYFAEAEDAPDITVHYVHRTYEVDRLGVHLTFHREQREANLSPLAWAQREVVSSVLRGFNQISSAWWLKGATTWWASSSGSGVACSNGSPCSAQTLACSGGSCNFPRGPGDTCIFKGTVASPQTYGPTATATLLKFWGGGTSTSGGQITFKAEQWRGVQFDCRAIGIGVNASGNCLDLAFGTVVYTTLQDLILINSSTSTRNVATVGGVSGDDSPPERGNGIGAAKGAGVKIIHCLVKDATNGIQGDGTGATGPREITYNISYYNGYEFTDRGHGHGFYDQNEATLPCSYPSAYLKLLSNLSFWQGDIGTQFYTQSGKVWCMEWTDNIEGPTGMGTSGSWLNGLRAAFSMGGSGTINCTSPTSGLVVRHPIVRRNEMYSDNVNSEGFKNGLGKGTEDEEVTDNFMAFAGKGMTTVPPCGLPDISRNTMYGTVGGQTCNQYGTGNVCPGPLPTSGQRVVYKTHPYVQGYGRALCYSWSSQATCPIDLTQLNLYNNEDYNVYTNYGMMSAPITTGTYTGSGTRTLNTSGYTVEHPGGDWPDPAATGPKWIVFEFEPQSGAGPAPTATNTPTNTATNTPSQTPTSSPTFTKTPTNTPSQTPTASNTPSQSPTASPTVTNTPSKTPTFTATNTPTVTPTPPPGSTIVLEAENCAPITAPMAITNDSLAFGGKYVSAESGTRSGSMTCTFVQVPAGTWKLWGRQFSLDQTHDSFFIKTGSDPAACGTDTDNTCTHIWDTGEIRECGGSCQIDTNRGAWLWIPLNDRGGPGCTGDVGDGSGNTITCTGIGAERRFVLGSPQDVVIQFRARDLSTRLDRLILTSDMNFEPTDAALTPTPRDTGRGRLPPVWGRPHPTVKPQ